MSLVNHSACLDEIKGSEYGPEIETFETLSVSATLQSVEIALYKVKDSIQIVAVLYFNSCGCGKRRT